MSYRSKSIRTLLAHYPWSEDVLDWHGLDLAEVNHDFSLDTACRMYNVDVGRVEASLATADVDSASTSDWDSFAWIAQDALAWAN